VPGECIEPAIRRDLFVRMWATDRPLGCDGFALPYVEYPRRVASSVPRNCLIIDPAELANRILAHADWLRLLQVYPVAALLLCRHV